MSETTNRIWALREAAKPYGFTPSARSVAEFAQSLEAEGLIRESDRGPAWAITEKGRAELAKLEAAH